VLKRILVPLDGSATAESVLPFVNQIASSALAEVLLVGAVTPLAVWDEANAAVKWEAEEATAADYIAAKRKELADGGLNVRSRVIFGPADKVVLSTAVEEGADLIAMTTHGRSGVVRLMLGSVTTKVVHESKIPVLLVRPAETGPAATRDTDQEDPRAT
jgi:nucleotide-binding universal stress UspA family protein